MEIEFGILVDRVIDVALRMPEHERIAFVSYLVQLAFDDDVDPRDFRVLH